MALVKNPHRPSRDDTGRRELRDYNGLINELIAADPTVRRWAARDLGVYAEAADDLLALIKVETDRSVREVALSSLTCIGTETAVAGLVGCLRSDAADLRNEASEAMKSLPQAVAPIMRALLHDPDPDVRILAINILESLCHPEVESWLLAVIDTEPVLNVCGTAVDLLSEVGTAAAREPLRRLRERFADEPYIQFATQLALKRLESA